eukprot:TRINITY_DN14067_c0_g2_i1.p1 TRINITY_DN14067_c0_g2~~TRINITY_DN14067_c0_g2_i1.p1  ORF type:complete len:355 (-),score=139.19 TRINITY_DN14067_c0_g2_i1:66-1130(-)
MSSGGYASAKAADGSPEAAAKDAYEKQLEALKKKQDGAEPSGPLADLVSSVMASGAEGGAFVEKTKEELAAMTKEERTAYHKARTAAAKAKAGAAPAAAEKSKAEKRAEAREKQEADRKRKEDAKEKNSGDAETLAELKLQGLTEDQAKEVLKQMKEAKVEAGDEEEEEEEDESLVGCVRTWMGEQPDGEAANKETLRDFNLKVRFQGHVETTPPDHLASMLEVIVSQLFKEKSLGSVKQPNVVEEKVTPTIQRWSYMIDKLYEKCDALEAATIVATSISTSVKSAGGDELSETARDIVVVGFLMAMRSEIESIEDEDLLTGCRRLESQSKVMQGFIAHLEDDGEDSDEDSEDE